MPGHAQLPPAWARWIGAPEKWLGGAIGALLGLALLKFGNPVILDFMIERPGNFYEYLFQPWPLEWGDLLLGGICLVAVPFWKPPKPAHPGARFLAWLPLAWFGWQLISTLSSAEAQLSWTTSIHFLTVVACFYLGWGVLSQFKNLAPFWLALIFSMLLVLWSGFEQHYGGLQNVREMVYSQPGWQNLPKTYLKKIATDRIFATLVYPNALAGVIILLFPVLLVVCWRLTEVWRPFFRLLAVGLFAYLGAAAFFWTGSKGGWLIIMGMALVVLLKADWTRRIPKHHQKLKWAILVLLMAGGAAGFLVKFSGYLKRGAPSANARLEYWRAAAITFGQHPVLGTGPGTFSVAYAKIKPAGAEMARLVHNDYLEQASDSGLAGFLLYGGVIWGGLWILYREWPSAGVRSGVSLGLFGWALQQFSEFPLYIPALAWTGFMFLGWSLAKASPATRVGGKWNRQAGSGSVSSAVS